MKSQAELQAKLREIDHKGYKAYKVLEGVIRKNISDGAYFGEKY